jgi:hypothetical protein
MERKMLWGIKQRAEHLAFDPGVGQEGSVASLSGVQSGG